MCGDIRHMWVAHIDARFKQGKIGLIEIAQVPIVAGLVNDRNVKELRQTRCLISLVQTDEKGKVRSTESKVEKSWPSHVSQLGCQCAESVITSWLLPRDASRPRAGE
jgi:hypothetical protein